MKGSLIGSNYSNYDLNAIYLYNLFTLNFFNDSFFD